MFQLQSYWAGDLPAKLVGMSCQAETPSLLPQVTLEDAGTISFQVGSCSSEAQLKVTGGQLLTMRSLLLRDVEGLLRGSVARTPSLPMVILPWGGNFPTLDWRSH